MEYVTVSRMAQKWGISDRSVRNYCEKGRIPGAKFIGKLWYLPEDSCKPKRINKRSKPSTEPTVSIKMDWLTSIKEIQKAQENNQLVIFVGAGVSKNSNVPTWWELIKKFADKIGYDRCIDCNFKSDDCPKEKCSLRFDFSQDEFLRIPEYYYQQDTSENHASYMSLIQNTLRGGTGPNPIDDVIFNLLPHHIITTNYDSLLEDSQNVNSQLYTVVCQDSDLLSKSNERYILKMHGDLELTFQYLSVYNEEFQCIHQNVTQDILMTLPDGTYYLVITAKGQGAYILAENTFETYGYEFAYKLLVDSK